MIDISTIKSLTIKEGKVKSICVNGVNIWNSNNSQRSLTLNVSENNNSADKK